MFLKHKVSALLLLTHLFFTVSSVPTDRICPVGWYSISPFNSCFHFGEEYFDFDRAVASCKSLSSTLATIHSATELQLFASIVTLERKMCLNKESCFLFWIGLNVSPTNDFNGDSLNWTWVVGTRVSPAPSYITMALSASQLASMRNRQCGALSAGNGSEPISVILKDCGQALRYVCRKELDCPEGFNRAAGSNTCYKWIPEPLSWENATKRCRDSAFGAHLVMPTSAAENDIIENYLRNTYNNSNTSACFYDKGPAVWTSGRRQTSRCNVPFVWIPFEGSAIAINYTNWVSGQPDCAAGLEHCIELTGFPNMITAWNDLICELPLCSLCQLAL